MNKHVVPCAEELAVACPVRVQPHSRSEPSTDLIPR